MTPQQIEQVREALRPLTETRDIERRFSLSERCDAVTCLVHAMDHIAKHEPDMLARINAGELIRDGIINALDSRSTGREHRTVRHRYRNERDGPHPPAVAEIDRRCHNCGAVGYQSFSYCHAHRPPTIASLLDPAASEPTKVCPRCNNTGRVMFDQVGSEWTVRPAKGNEHGVGCGPKCTMPKPASDLLARLEAAERERDEATSRLDAMKNPATLRSMNYTPGQPMTFDVEHPIVSIMAAHLAEAVGTAENYIETEMTHEDGRAFVLMIRRKHGKTPHFLRREAEARAETAEQERDEARRLGVIEARNAVANISMLISERDAQKVRAETAERANLGLRKRVHQLDLHNQHFERCESRWCHPSKSSFAELYDPAIEFAQNTTFLNQDLDTWQTRLAAAEQRNWELEAALNAAPCANNCKSREPVCADCSRPTGRLGSCHEAGEVVNGVALQASQYSDHLFPHYCNCWKSALASGEPKPQADDNFAWLIYFNDAGMAHEVFSGVGAEAIALKRFGELQLNWSCHLFREVVISARGSDLLAGVGA